MRKIVSLCIYCFFSLNLTAQNQVFENQFSNKRIESLIEKFESFAFSIPIEKVYLHIDKPSYFAGEDIWFKAYVVDGTYHIMRSVSNVLYVEILNSDNELIKRHRLNITDGYAIGDFILDRYLPQGKYLIRAYTNGMKNFDHQFIFHKYINIFNSSIIDSLDLNKNILSHDIDLQFFPEGGSLIEGLPSQLAFKAIDISGKAIEVEGEIYNLENNLVASFRTNHYGMGKINFETKKKEKYYAIITSQESKLKYKIPDPLKQGYVLSIDNTSKYDLIVDIHTNIPNKSIWIVGQSGGKVYCSAEINMNKTNKKVKISKSIFPSGIIQFTLFDHKKRPFSERLVFIQNEEDFLNISLVSDKSSYKPREKVELTIKATDRLGVPQKTNLSLSVTDFSQINSADSLSDNIYSYLLLSSDLKETIENPGYYFIDNNPERLKSLDNLLMTQGWRRFSWQKALEVERISCNYFFEKGLVVNGKIVNCPKRYPVEENTLVMMFSAKGSHSKILSIQSDSTFSFELPSYSGSGQVIVQSLNKSGKAISLGIEIDSTDINDFSYEPDFLSSYMLSENQKQLMRERRFLYYYFKDDSTEFIEEVGVNAERIQPQEKPDTYRDLAEGGIFVNDLNVKYNNVLEYLKHIPGVLVTRDKRSNRYSVKLRRAEVSSFMLDSDPLFVVDDIPMDADFAVSVMESMDTENLLYVNVLKGAEASLYGARANCGVIIIYTKKTNGMSSNKSLNGYQEFELNGFYSNREYYYPNYDIPKKEHKKIDLRSSIYWNPNIQTDENGEAIVTFFNSNRVTRIKARIEGVSSEGNPGVQEFYYEVL